MIGGFVGFSAVAASGLLAGRSGDRVLFDAAIGCLVGALLFRWFWSRMIAALGVAVQAKRAERRAAEEAQAAARATSVSPAKTK